jgi:hypothetical protein
MCGYAITFEEKSAATSEGVWMKELQWSVKSDKLETSRVSLEEVAVVESAIKLTIKSSTCSQ